MSTDADDKFWDDHAAKLREFAKMRLLTPEEAEEAARSAPPVPLSDDEIRRIVAAARPCEPEAEEGSAPDWLDEAGTEEVEEGVLQLNRNKGDADPDTDAIEEALRRRMLDDEEDAGGMDGGKKPPRCGGP